MSETENPESPPRRPSALRAGFFTIFGFVTIAGLAVMPAVAGSPAEESLSQWGRFLGRLHPLVLHLPIGMLVMLILMEFGRLFRKDKGPSTQVWAFFTAASAVVAAVFGFLLYQSTPGDYSEELVQSHLWWGIGFAGAMVATFVLKVWIDFSGGVGNFLYVLMLIGSAGVMGIASHDGGSLTRGTTYLTKDAPPEVLRLLEMLPGGSKAPAEKPDVEDKPKADPDGEGGEAPATEVEAPVTPVADQTVFAQLVQPIFDQKCVSCHGEEKQKGKLRMDSYDALVKGGKEGEAFEAGNLEDSNLLIRIHLPEDDDEHMPPEGKKQLDANEIAVIEWWIANGASPDEKLADAEMSDEVRMAVSKLVPAEVLAAEQAEADQAAAEQADAREAVAKQLEELRKVFPAALNFESQESSGLTFTAVSMRTSFDDEQLAKLQPVMPSLVTLDLSSSVVTDKGMPALADARSLKMLRLSETAITDSALEVLASLPELESLNLYGTAVTQSGVEKLAALPKLKRLYLWQTKVDDSGVEKLRELMPDCEIVMGL